MKVKELIEQLKQFDLEREVRFQSPNAFPISDGPGFELLEVLTSKGRINTDTYKFETVLLFCLPPVSKEDVHKLFDAMKEDIKLFYPFSFTELRECCKQMEERENECNKPSEALQQRSI